MDLSCVTAADALPACATLDEACGWGEAGSGSSGGGPAAAAAGSIGDTECRLGMADVFWGHFNYLKASGNSTDIQDLPICLTDEGKPHAASLLPKGALGCDCTVLERPPVSLSEKRSMFVVQAWRTVLSTWWRVWSSSRRRYCWAWWSKSPACMPSDHREALSSL